ncbi:hypothetical protein C5167_039209 [Papaver somniferum]|uniref:Uncharacterized protein n=1 Tax=Papaver somniferum TaxID=3469 RepID=A0A4Y7IF08_PAPSO|nr:hypothetical protein C5167_039209 [Papaver somniferum]
MSHHGSCWKHFLQFMSFTTHSLSQFILNHVW